MQRSKRGLAPWQARWVTLHDDLHLLEVLLEAIAPSPEYTNEYWALSTDVITYSQDLEEAYQQELFDDNQGRDDTRYNALRRRLILLQARAQALSLENELD